MLSNGTVKMIIDINTLNESAFLKSLEKNTLDNLLAQSHKTKFDAGAIILREGDAADDAYILLTGTVQIYKQKSNGERLFLHQVLPGSLFGEQAIIHAQNRNASARAQTEVEVLRLPERALLAAVATDPEVRKSLVLLGDQQLLENLARDSSILKSMKLDGGPSQSARERILRSSEVLFREGDEANHVYVILSGTAAIYQDKDGAQVLLAQMTAGQMLGELALMQNAPRAATAIAEGALRLYEIDADYFREMTASSEELRHHLQVLERVYILPRRGFVTQYKGDYIGREAFNTLYDLSSGTRFVASNVIGDSISNLERVQADQEQALPVTILSYADSARAIGRELRLNQSGQIWGLTAFGSWSELPDIYAMAMDGAALDAAQIEQFERTGSIGISRQPDNIHLQDSILCQCINVKRQSVRSAIMQGADTLETLQKTTRCGTVCGGCVSQLREMLGKPNTVAVQIKEEIDVCEGIKTFKLEPLNNQVQPSLPGQHVVIEAEIDGQWISRPYTLSAPVSGGYYEVTIKREPMGQFSRWMFDERRANTQLKVSPPQGNFHWEPSQSPVICLVAGIGITPALAICRTFVESQISDRLHIDYSARGVLDFAYASEMTEATQTHPNITLKLRATSVEPRLSYEEIEELEVAMRNAHYYLCGPQSYLDNMSELLTRARVDTERIHREVFVHVGGLPFTKALRKNKSSRRKQPDAADLALFFVNPEPRHAVAQPPKLLRWIANLGTQNKVELTISGKKIKPLTTLIDWVEYKLGGVDPSLPSEHLALPRTAVYGRSGASGPAFADLDRRFEDNRERGRLAIKAGKPLPPNTPDGRTYTTSFPSFNYPQFEWLLPKVDTGWYRSSNKPLSCAYVTRSPHAAREILCSKNIDRGPLPNHYWQKTIGTPKACPHGQTKAGGSLIGQYHNNMTWQRDRDLAIGLVSPAVLAERSGSIAEIVEDIFNHEIDVFTAKHPGQVVDAGVLMGEIVLRVVLRTVFPGVEADLIQRLGAKYLSVVTNEAIPTILQLIQAPTDENKLKDRILEMTARLRHAIDDIASAVRQAHAEGKLSEQDVASPMNHYTIFGLDGKQPDDEDLISIYGTFLIGAHETTAHLLTWALYELGRNPDLYKKVQKEVDAFSATHQGCAMTPHDYDERPMMLALLFELNRLHPGIAMNPRCALEAGTISPDPETGIGGFDYPADTIFIVDILAMHLDPETYFKPTEFHIERFLEGIGPDMSLAEQGAKVRQNAINLEKQFKWLPFAAGPGNCPGRNFNMIEFFLVMDCLMRSYDLILANPNLPPGFDESSIVTKPLERIGIELVRR